jgi:hypothetical protein
MAKVSRKALDWWLVACADSTVVAIIAWKHHFGEVTTSVALASGLICLAVLNIVFLAAVNARNKRHGLPTAGSFFAGAVGMAVVSSLVMAGAVYRKPERNEDVDLALSNTPLSEIHPQRKAILVQLLRRRQAISQEYQKEVAQMKPICPALYSPASFASASAMHDLMSELTQAYDADVSNAAQQKQSMDEFRVEMGRADPDYLKSFEAADQRDEEHRNNITDLEEKWFNSTIALYKYAASHSKEITVREGQLRFGNSAVQSEFSRELQGSKTLYNGFQEQVQEGIREHTQNRRKVGLAPDF